MTVATAGQIILSMLKAEEHQHHAHPGLRVNNTTFATLWPAEARAVVKFRTRSGEFVEVFAESSLDECLVETWLDEHPPSARHRENLSRTWRAIPPNALCCSISTSDVSWRRGPVVAVD